MKDSSWYCQHAREYCGNLAVFLARFGHLFLSVVQKSQGDMDKIRNATHEDLDIFGATCDALLTVFENLTHDCIGVEWTEQLPERLPSLALNFQFYNYKSTYDLPDLEIQSIEEFVEQSNKHFFELVDVALDDEFEALITPKYDQYRKRIQIDSLIDFNKENRVDFKSVKLVDIKPAIACHQNGIVLATHVVECLMYLPVEKVKENLAALERSVFALRKIVRSKPYLGIRFVNGTAYRAEWPGRIKVSGLQSKLLEMILKAKEQGVSREYLIASLYPGDDCGDADNKFKSVKKTLSDKLGKNFGLTINEYNAVVEL